MHVNPRESRELVISPTKYLEAQGKSLDERIADVSLPAGSEEIIVSGKAKRLVRDKVLGLFKVGEIVNEILNWNETVNEDINKAKRDVLIAEFFDKSEKTELAVTQLRQFLLSAHGNTLFNKILRILDASPPDVQLIDHLSSALRHIVDGDFAALFEDYRYALAQIEQVSPQALAILADHGSWPEISIGGSYSAAGPKLTSDWLTDFSKAYSEAKRIVEERMRTRVQYSISELINRGYLEAHLIRERVAKCHITSVGQMVLPYVTR